MAKCFPYAKIGSKNQHNRTLRVYLSFHLFKQQKANKANRIKTSIPAKSIHNYSKVICQKSPILAYPSSHLHLAPPLRVTPFEYRQELWRQKTTFTGLSRRTVSMILCLAFLTQYRHVMNTHTRRHIPH